MMRDKIAAMALDAINGVYEDSGNRAEHAERFTDAILAALPGMVPDLVWEDIGGYHYRAPAPLLGNIRIESYTEGKFDVVWSVPGFCDVLVPEGFPTIEAAKAAANTHHRAAIAKSAGWTP